MPAAIINTSKITADWIKAFWLICAPALDSIGDHPYEVKSFISVDLEMTCVKLAAKKVDAGDKRWYDYV